MTEPFTGVVSGAMAWVGRIHECLDVAEQLISSAACGTSVALFIGGMPTLHQHVTTSVDFPVTCFIERDTSETPSMTFCLQLIVCVLIYAQTTALSAFGPASVDILWSRCLVYYI